VEALTANAERQLKASTSSGTEALERDLANIKSSLCQATSEAQHLEHQTRLLLTSSRSEQVAAQRALLIQIRRMQALEAMRMADMQEIHRLERCVC